jgi:hypothetical protein
VRVHVKRRPHDFAQGIYRFTCDEDRLIHASLYWATHLDAF